MENTSIRILIATMFLDNISVHMNSFLVHFKLCGTNTFGGARDIKIIKK